jgi:hypothetical protein
MNCFCWLCRARVLFSNSVRGWSILPGPLRGASSRVRYVPPVALLARRWHGLQAGSSATQDPCRTSPAGRIADSGCVGWLSERSRMCRTTGATVDGMSTSQQPAPSVPISDHEWRELLEEVGLLPRAQVDRLGAWHYCPACRLTIRADRVGWWGGASSSATTLEFFDRIRDWGGQKTCGATFARAGAIGKVD